MTEIKSHLTAVARKTLPKPTRWLIEKNQLGGDILDYGCGRCSELNNKILGKLPTVKSVWNYDPYYSARLPNRYFDVIICNYVLCVTPIEMERTILQDIRYFLKSSGVAYISVRNDIPRQGHGISSKKTFQRWVELDLPLVRKTREFRMYTLYAHNKIS